MEEPDVLELTRKLGREPNVETALHIMQWNLGELTKSCTYMKWHPDLGAAYQAEAKLAMASLMFQSCVIMSLLGFDGKEVMDIGVETVQDRIKEMEKKVGRFAHYEGDNKDA